MESADVFHKIAYFCRLLQFLSYRPLKRVWADPPSAVGVSVNCLLPTVFAHSQLYTVHSLLSTVFCPLPTVHCLLFAVHCRLSSTPCPLSTTLPTPYCVYCPQSTIHSPLSTAAVLCPLSTTLWPLSTATLHFANCISPASFVLLAFSKVTACTKI
jgi:hypothetical protein